MDTILEVEATIVLPHVGFVDYNENNDDALVETNEDPVNDDDVPIQVNIDKNEILLFSKEAIDETIEAIERTDEIRDEGEIIVLKKTVEEVISNIVDDIVIANEAEEKSETIQSSIEQKFSEEEKEEAELLVIIANDISNNGETEDQKEQEQYPLEHMNDFVEKEGEEKQEEALEEKQEEETQEEKQEEKREEEGEEQQEEEKQEEEPEEKEEEEPEEKEEEEPEEKQEEEPEEKEEEEQKEEEEEEEAQEEKQEETQEEEQKEEEKQEEEPEEKPQEEEEEKQEEEGEEKQEEEKQEEKQEEEEEKEKEEMKKEDSEAGKEVIDFFHVKELIIKALNGAAPMTLSKSDCDWCIAFINKCPETFETLLQVLTRVNQYKNNSITQLGNAAHNLFYLESLKHDSIVHEQKQLMFVMFIMQLLNSSNITVLNKAEEKELQDFFKQIKTTKKNSSCCSYFFFKSFFQ